MKILDLFCGAGGAGMGLYRAGFEVHGIDLYYQPNYPFKIVRGNAIYADLKGYDAVWASPPCQQFSSLSQCRPGTAEMYPNYIPYLRKKFNDYGIPYIIENVIGAPLWQPILLCGGMFQIDVRRHRIFETNMDIRPLVHRCNKVPKVVQYSSSKRAKRDKVSFLQGMGIDWYMTLHEAHEAIPPIYSEYLGKELIRCMGSVV